MRPSLVAQLRVSLLSFLGRLEKGRVVCFTVHFALGLECELFGDCFAFQFILYFGESVHQGSAGEG